MGTADQAVFAGFELLAEKQRLCAKLTRLGEKRRQIEQQRRRMTVEFRSAVLAAHDLVAVAEIARLCGVSRRAVYDVVEDPLLD